MVRCGSCYDRTLGGLYAEVRDTEQFERVGFPLGEQVIHICLAVVGTGQSGRDANNRLVARRLNPNHPSLPSFPCPDATLCTNKDAPASALVQAGASYDSSLSTCNNHLFHDQAVQVLLAGVRAVVAPIKSTKMDTTYTLSPSRSGIIYCLGIGISTNPAPLPSRYPTNPLIESNAVPDPSSLTTAL